MRTISSNNNDIFSFLLVSTIGVMLTVLMNYLIVIPLLLFILYYLSTINKKKTLLWVVIVTLFTLVGELNPSLRLAVQLLDITILSYLFLSEYGLAFKDYPKIPRWFIPFIVIYFIAFILSILMSSYPFTGIGYFVRQTVFFVIVYLLYALIKDEKDIKNYFSALIFAAFVMASSSIFTFIFNSSSFFDFASGNRDRIAGIISNPNNIANFYLVSFPFLIISILLRKKIFSSKLSWFLIAFFTFALILTISRSAIMGIIISTLIILYFLKKKYFSYIIIFSVILILLVFINDSLYNYLSLFFRLERGVTGRDYLWELSLNIIKDNPIFGLGPGGYKYEMFNYLPVKMESWIGGLFIRNYVITDGANLSHNYFLFLFSELGILGFIVSIYLPFLFIKFFKLIKQIKDKQSETFYIIIALLSIGISEFIRGIVESIGMLYFGAITADLPFWLVFISLTFYLETMFKNSKYDLKQNHDSMAE